MRQGEISEWEQKLKVVSNPLESQPLHLVKWWMAYPFMGVPPHELVDGQDDLAQLGPRDTAVPVDVVQLEGPPQLLVDGASQQSRQCN